MVLKWIPGKQNEVWNGFARLNIGISDVLF